MNWARVGAVMQLEVRVQRREPLTVLYMLVFALLAMAFAAAGPVELVRDRGAVPRDAPWSLMLASTAITAFGQVITTMVAATVVLRDRADRVAELLAATRLTRREYLLAKLLASLLMLTVIYAAIPLGLIIGSALGGGTIGRAVVGTLPPFLLVVLPTMLAIGALQFAVGVASGRLWAIVGQGLLLIWLWTAAIGWVGGGATGVVSLLDPFGSAPLLQATRNWSDAERQVRAMPWSPTLLVSRAVWLAFGFVAAAVAVMRAPVTGRVTGASSTTPEVLPEDARSVALRQASSPHWWRGMGATAQYVSRWMLRDTGWRVLAMLGALNVAVHAWTDVAATRVTAAPTAIALAALQEHARLFLILLATIYAGELVWREREERSGALFAAMPISDGALLTGRVVGAVAAQCVLVLLLALAAAAGVAAAGGGLATGVLAGALHGVLLPFITWMLVALAIHVLVQQKVVAHLLCIAGWALASLRFGAAAPGADGAIPTWALWITCLVAWIVVWWWWARDVTGHRPFRRRTAARLPAAEV